MIRDEVEREVEVGDKVLELPELGKDPMHESKNCLVNQLTSYSFRRAYGGLFRLPYLPEAQSLCSSVLNFLHPKRHTPKVSMSHKNETFPYPNVLAVQISESDVSARQR
jgi:hypothetical protein